ncbi:MAG: glucan biosynthesis protein, partial [Limisphaerales bacterium]
LRLRASELAKKAYTPPAGSKLPEELENLDYDQYQQVRFRPASGPWYDKKLLFDLRFISRGYLFRDPVKLHLLEGDQNQEIPFRPSMFDYSRLSLKSPLPEGLDFAGFKLMHRSTVNAPWSEVASFLGASYFRIVGKGLRYGASARALALDTGEAAGEEFPRLTEFWIETPAPLAANVQVLALLESPSVAGACRFLLNVGDQTSTEVEVSLFPRLDTKKYGIAPLTSMFLIGENRTSYIPDFRPEVHDSDGLLMVTAGGERVWRPLENPKQHHRISRFPLRGLAGFGLMQRDRSYRSYEDLEARYELRPSLWVEPLAAWGEGVIELVEIPSPSEYNDNIVAYWVPAQKPKSGQEMRFRYRLSAVSEEPQSRFLKVTATRIVPAVDKKPERFVVDFEGATLDTVGARDRIQPRCSIDDGEVKNLQALYNDVTGGWRVVFDVDAAGSEARQVRLYLEAGGKPLSETWVQELPTP